MTPQRTKRMYHEQRIQTIDGMVRRHRSIGRERLMEILATLPEGCRLFCHPITNDLCVHTMDIDPIGRIDIAEETYERDHE
jgi:hypothetical protein